MQKKKSRFRLRQNRCNVWADSAWLCIFHFPLCTSQGIKASLKNKVMDQFHVSLVPPCQFFLSLSLSLSPSPSLSFSGWSLGTQRLSAFTFLPGLQRPMWERAQGRAPFTIQVNAGGLNEQSKSLFWVFISFLCKPRSISLFLSYIFLTAIFPSLSLSISLNKLFV